MLSHRLSTLLRNIWITQAHMSSCCSLLTARHSTLSLPPNSLLSFKMFGPVHPHYRPQLVRNTSIGTFNTEALQGCMLTPLLDYLYNHDSVAKHSFSAIYKFSQCHHYYFLNHRWWWVGVQERDRIPGWVMLQQQPLAQVNKTSELLTSERGSQETRHLFLCSSVVEKVSNF